MKLSQIIPVSGIVAGTLLPYMAWTGPAADLGYPQVMDLLTETQGNPAQVRPKLVGKTVGATLVAGKNSLWVVSPDDGVYFACAASAPGFKGGPVVAKVIQYEAPDNGEGGEPHLTLDRCSN